MEPLHPLVSSTLFPSGVLKNVFHVPSGLSDVYAILSIGFFGRSLKGFELGILLLKMTSKTCPHSFHFNEREISSWLLIRSQVGEHLPSEGSLSFADKAAHGLVSVSIHRFEE